MPFYKGFHREKKKSSFPNSLHFFFHFFQLRIKIRFQTFQTEAEQIKWIIGPWRMQVKENKKVKCIETKSNCTTQRHQQLKPHTISKLFRFAEVKWPEHFYSDIFYIWPFFLLNFFLKMNCKCQTEKHAMQCLHNFFFQFLSEWQSAIQSRGFSSLFFSFSPIEQEVANRPSVRPSTGPASSWSWRCMYTQTHNNNKNERNATLHLLSTYSISADGRFSNKFPLQQIFRPCCFSCCFFFA